MSSSAETAATLDRVTSHATRVFVSEEKAARWLRRPKPRLARRTPLEAIQTQGGSELVEEMPMQLDFGFVA